MNDNVLIISHIIDVPRQLRRLWFSQALDIGIHMSIESRNKSISFLNIEIQVLTGKGYVVL